MHVRALLFVVLLPPAAALAEDLKATDGTVYRHTKIVQVDPDGVIVEHDKGRAKVDFRLLPRDMQQRLGFNERKAAIYRTQEKQRAEQTAQENQRLIQDHEQRVMANIRRQMEINETGDEISYSGGGGSRSEARLTAQLNRDMDAHSDALLAASREPRTFWNAPFWKSPVVQFLGMVLGGGGGAPEKRPMGNGAGWDNSHSFDH